MQKALQEEEGSKVEVVKFYSYDIHVEGYPKGIHRGNSLPEDTDDSMDGTIELEMIGLPKLYILPAREKGMPYRQYYGEATAANFLNFIAKNAQNDIKVIQKKTLSTLASFGATADDDKAFYYQLEKEGLCNL